MQHFATAVVILVLAVDSQTGCSSHVISTQRYVCQIHSCQHIEVRALEGGYLQEIGVKEAVKKGELLFKIMPVLFEARLATEEAEAQRAQIEFDNAKSLAVKGIVSPQELALKKEELTEAQAKVTTGRVSGCHWERPRISS